jgi:hypothetical protein
MSILIELFELILFKRKAKDISFSKEAAGIAFVAYTASSYFQLGQSQILQQPVMFALVQAVSLAAIFYIILSIAKKRERFTQMITALFGASAILQFTGLVLAVLPGLLIVGTVLSILNIVIMIVILRDTLEINTLQAILLGIFSHFAVGTILFFVFPEFFQSLQSIMQASQQAS